MLIRLRSLSPPPVRIGTPPLPVLALGLTLAGQLTLTGRGNPWLAVLLLAGGGTLIVVAALRASAGRRAMNVDSTPAVPPTASDPGTPDCRPDQPASGLIGGPAGVAVLALVIVVAAAFRLPGLDRLPPGLAAGEAVVGLDAMRVLAGGWSALAWHGWPIFHLLTIGSVAALGQTVLAVRLPDALAGMAFAPALFLLGRQLESTRLGAVAALLGAVAFWHADLTRAAWGYGAWGLTCETLGLALLLRTVRQPSPGATALAGLLLGVALQASWGALAAIVAGVLLAFGRPRAAWEARHRLGAVLGPFLVYFAVAAGPVLIGVAIPDHSLDVTAASPVASTAAPSPLELARRAGRTLLMFNVAGDPSPLHALRAEPMLDPITGSLLILGMVLALLRWRDTRTSGLVLWLLLALAVAAVAGGPAQPNALLAVHALPPALLLAAGAVISTSGGLARRRSGGLAWHLDLTLTLIALIVAINGHALYVRRPTDPATWTAYASAEALAARQISKLTPTSTIYLADVWLDHPTIRFLAQGLTDPRRLDPATTLPLVHDEPFAYFSPGSQDVVADDLERVYEDGEIDRFRSPLDETTIVARSFRAGARVVTGARGVTLRAVANDRGRSNRYTLQDFQVNWPVEGESARPSTLEVFGAVAVEVPGVYRLRMTGPPGTTLEVNGVATPLTGDEARVTLARGSQRFRVVAAVDGPGLIDLQWMPPGSTAFVPIPRDRIFREQRDAIGLLAVYRSGVDPAAPPELKQVERYLQRDSAPPVLARPYVVDWIGMLDAGKSGTYRFQLDGSGPASLWLDDRPVLLGDHPNGQTASVVLTEGNHRIQVRLIDTVGPTRLNLAWAPPGDEMVSIPTSRFLPPDAPVETVTPIGLTPDAAFAPLGTPRVHWLASTDGEPRAVAVQPDGDVFLSNVTARQIQHVVGQGQGLVSLPATVSVPTDLEVGPDGSLWALDALLGEVVQLGQDGAIERALPTGELGLYRPRGLAIAPDGTVLIADTGGSRIVRLTGEGKPIDVIGPDIGGPARIRQPTDVAVGPDGQIFVVDGEAGALLRLSPSGTYERHWPILPADTERGSHLAIGADRTLWVSEPEGRRVSRFTFDGAPAGVVDQTSAGRLLRVPVGIAFGPDGTLYVADVSLRAVLALNIAR